VIGLPNEFKETRQVAERIKLFPEGGLSNCVVRRFSFFACHSCGAFAHGVKIKAGAMIYGICRMS
jgi:hypothetical protein